MNNNSIPSAFMPILDVWKAPQIGLRRVVRWKKYIGAEPDVRLQNALQHSHAITILGAMVATEIQPYVKRKGMELDRGLLMTALAVHDLGEGETGKDTLYIDKSIEGDLEEYQAFLRRYKLSKKGPMFNYLHRAFLLQFALANPQNFPLSARALMSGIAITNRLEAMVFDVVERWDYVLYAVEQYYERGNEKILVQTLRHQIPHLNRLSNELPGFGEKIWTKEISIWATELLKDCDGKYEEQKGEI